MCVDCCCHLCCCKHADAISECKKSQWIDYYFLEYWKLDSWDLITRQLSCNAKLPVLDEECKLNFKSIRNNSDNSGYTYTVLKNTLFLQYILYNTQFSMCNKPMQCNQVTDQVVECILGYSYKHVSIFLVWRMNQKDSQLFFEHIFEHPLKRQIY